MVISQVVFYDTKQRNGRSYSDMTRLVVHVFHVNIVRLIKFFTQHTDVAGKAGHCIAVNIRLLLTTFTGDGDVSINSQSPIALNKHLVYRASKFRWCTVDFSPATPSSMRKLLPYTISFNMPHKQKTHGFRSALWLSQSTISYSGTKTTLWTTHNTICSVKEMMLKHNILWTYGLKRNGPNNPRCTHSTPYTNLNVVQKQFMD